jgi:hypothetical protein
MAYLRPTPQQGRTLNLALSCVHVTEHGHLLVYDPRNRFVAISTAFSRLNVPVRATCLILAKPEELTVVDLRDTIVPERHAK